MDINRVALWIGILGPLLAVPLAIAANLLTPRVVNWWASASQARRIIRIMKLETLLSNLQHAWRLSDAAWSSWKLMVAVLLAMMLFFQSGTVMLVIIMGQIADIHRRLGLPSPDQYEHRLRVMSYIFAAILGNTGFIIILFMVNRYRAMRLHTKEG